MTYYQEKVQNAYNKVIALISPGLLLLGGYYMVETNQFAQGLWAVFLALWLQIGINTTRLQRMKKRLED